MGRNNRKTKSVKETAQFRHHGERRRQHRCGTPPWGRRFALGMGACRGGSSLCTRECFLISHPSRSLPNLAQLLFTEWNLYFYNSLKIHQISSSIIYFYFFLIVWLFSIYIILIAFYYSKNSFTLDTPIITIYKH